MKVLFLGSDKSIFTKGSPARERMRAYAEAFGELHILSSAKNDAREEQEGALFLHPIHASRLFAVLPLITRARALIRTHQIDVVSAQDPFEHGWMALQAVRGTRAKLDVQVHTDFLSPWFIKNGGFRSIRVRMPILNTIRRHLADRILPHVSGIRVVSKRIKGSLIARYGTRIPEPDIIPIGASLQIPSPAPLPVHSFSFALITVSRLEPEKRIEDILMALGRLKLEYPSLGLFVVGEGRERARLTKLARELGLTDRVVFLGWREDAHALMQSAQAFIQASAYEGYGVSLIEAALAKLPIITTDVGIVGEVFKGYDDVLSAPVADPAALSAHIASLIKDHQLRKTLAMNAERAAKGHLVEYQDRTERFRAHIMNIGSRIA